MLRHFHSLPGLIAALFIIILSVTGAILALNPVLERATATVPATGQMSIAQLAGKVAQHYSGVEQIKRSPSGSLIVYYSQDNKVGVDRIDPLSGQAIAPYSSSSFTRWIKNLHRSLLLDTAGRATVGIVALVLLMLAVTGIMLLAARVGGWRNLLRPVRGTLSQRMHLDLGRMALVGLILSSLTGAYLSAVNFEFISAGQEGAPEFPLTVAVGLPASVDSLAVLQAIDLNDLHELVFPYADDPYGVYSLSTQQGAGYIDQVTGEWLAYETHNQANAVYEFIYMLHTGEGLWWLAIILGLSALLMPVMAITGTIIWWNRQRSKQKILANSNANSADTIILVGSESNSTWGFAKTLHEGLVKAKIRVHTAPMNQLSSNYRSAKQLIILTSTYGDGDAPASASRFLTKLEKAQLPPALSTSVLGFGDRQYPLFCGFAKQVEDALAAKGLPQLLAFDTIDRQSAQEFSRWGIALGKALEVELNLIHTPARPKTLKLELVERVDYGEEVQAPTAVLRFKAPKDAGNSNFIKRLLKINSLPHFEAGDLVGILPPGSQVPRFYSLASGSKDNTLEICVRHQSGGLCSSFLYALPVGASIDVFIQPNPNFRPASGKAPTVLIGAGTGIGPLVGFIRHNKAHNPMHLYWGGRCPNSDFLYEPELKSYLQDKRLTELNAVFSHDEKHSYVQDKISLDGEELRSLIKDGAQILVCGGRNMANSVAATISEIIAPVGMDLATLKAQGRYREDVY